MKSVFIATILGVAAAAPAMNAPVDVDALATTPDMALARHVAHVAISRRQNEQGGGGEQGDGSKEGGDDSTGVADEEIDEGGDGQADDIEQGELAFQAAVEECQIKLAAGQTDTLDDCVLDILGIDRRIQRRQLTGISQEDLEAVTGQCSDEHEGDPAAIYECILEASAAAAGGEEDGSGSMQRRQLH